MDYPGEQGAQNYVPFTRTIIEKYKEFFKSDVGGCWNEDEFIDLYENYGYFNNGYNPGTCLSTELLKLKGYAYVIIVFIGHGCNHEKLDQIQITSKEITPISNFLPFIKKGLVIIDSCRSYLSEDAISIPKLILESQMFGIRERNRDYYNNLIVDAPDHIEIIQSTQKGEIARTIPHEKNSVFSKAFFEVLGEKNKLAREKQISGQANYISYNDIKDEVDAKMAGYGFSQQESQFTPNLSNDNRYLPLIAVDVATI